MKSSRGRMTRRISCAKGWPTPGRRRSRCAGAASAIEQVVEGRLCGIGRRRAWVPLVAPVPAEVGQACRAHLDRRIEGADAQATEALASEDARVEHAALRVNEHEVIWVHLGRHDGQRYRPAALPERRVADRSRLTWRLPSARALRWSNAHAFSPST